MTIPTCNAEARGFAQACVEYANGVDDPFTRGAFRKAAEVINNLCDQVINMTPDDKEKEEGKERTSPHTPYREKGKEKKKTTTTTRARVREGFIPPSQEEVLAFAELKSIPPLFVDYWFKCMNENYNPPWYNSVSQRFITAWRRSLLCFWAKSPKDKAWAEFMSAKKAEATIKAKDRKYTAEEWCLCAERCAHFDAGTCRCRSGGTVPPQLRPHPMPPEECERFHPKQYNAKK